MKYLSFVVGVLFCTAFTNAANAGDSTVPSVPVVSATPVVPVGPVIPLAPPVCNPSTQPTCKHYTGVMPGVGVHIDEPSVYYAGSGVHQGWLIPKNSLGTWRIRLMQFDMITAYEKEAMHSHFHQVAQSDLTVAGPIQYIEFKTNTGYFKQQIECEDDCTNMDFDFYILTP